MADPFERSCPACGSGPSKRERRESVIEVWSDDHDLHAFTREVVICSACDEPLAVVPPGEETL